MSSVALSMAEPSLSSLLCLLLAFDISFVHCELVIYPHALGVNASDKFEVYLSQDGYHQSSFTYITLSNVRVKYGHYVKPNRSVSWTSFAFDGNPVSVTVKTQKDFQSCRVAPRSYGIQCSSVDSRTAQFSVTRNNSWMSVEFDFDPATYTHEVQDKLLVFADEPETDVPSPNDPNVFYLDVGVWDLRAQATLCSRNYSQVYLAPGAFVKGGFISDGDRPVRIYGRGILCGSEFAFHDPRFDRAMVDLQDGVGNVLEGVTIVDPEQFYVVTGNGAVVRGVKMLGAWTYNSDGVSTYENGLVENCFIMANDDSIKIFYNNITVRNMVVWQMQNGGVFQHGWWIHRNIRDVLVHDIDIIHTDWCTFKGSTTCTTSPNDSVYNTNKLYNAFIQNIIFRNIRIEGPVSRFVYTVLPSNATGYVRDILFENVQIDFHPTDGLLHNQIQGTADALFSDWTFYNVSVGGRCIASAQQGDFLLDPESTRNIRFICPP